MGARLNFPSRLECAPYLKAYYFYNADMDESVLAVPGMEGFFFRRRDAPSFYNVKEVTNPTLQFFINETFNSTKASALILNTVDDLDEPFLSQIGVSHSEQRKILVMLRLKDNVVKAKDEHVPIYDIDERITRSHQTFGVV
ncbi:hypothetical protein Scep_009729 [Stephania cephalantha]|uniref:Uncharacterized protein n=1 Tax=Stephania cephalantha TaxID=152367 RepID=A0AAP0PCR9_9MAGN